MEESGSINKPMYCFLPIEIEGIDSLGELALDLRWSWNHAADEIWQALDPELWRLTHNPWTVLQTVSHDQLRRKLKDAGFLARVNELIEARRADAEAPAWFQTNWPDASLTCVAYFSMEFMLSEALPIYSGGLGNVAGDQLKAASDLGVPVVGIGLLYQQGYFRQVINNDGSQQAFFPYNDPGQLPITPLRQSNGEWLRLEIVLPGYSVWLRTWQVQVGKVRLLLLDSNDPANIPIHQGITSELYGGGTELRLKQELILGIGGWRLLKALGLEPQVCHLNEGHAAFAILERANHFMHENGVSFEVALWATRAGNLFTTHTAVAAGFDRYAPNLIWQYLGVYAIKQLGISIRDLLALGRQNPDDMAEYFNMAYLAIRGSGAVNGVSRLHGKVSRNLFAPIFPHWPVDEVPVNHITNGVHMPSWDSASSDKVWMDSCGKQRWLGTTEMMEADIRKIPLENLWQMRVNAVEELVAFAREKLSVQLAASGSSPRAVEEAMHVFNPRALTLGFARRFATYKRPNLLLSDPERLKRILTSPDHPVQLIIAGKAHPADEEGQLLIKSWINFIHQPDIRGHVIFLSDYDMLLAERLVQGVDVWLNTPRRPWEASGTSGMKVLVNGGLNLSELDGWWAEAYTPEVGWALGDGFEHGDDPGMDAQEAQQLYDLLEFEVIPEFYQRDENQIPVAWVNRIMESMARLTPQFSANRTVREYTEQHYLPAAEIYYARAAQKAALSKQIGLWKQSIDQKWPLLNFGDVVTTTSDSEHYFEAEVYLNDLNPEAVAVEIFADGLNGAPIWKQKMTRDRQLPGAYNCYIYQTRVSADRPAADYTLRIVPALPGVVVPLEAANILWQK